MHLYVLRGHWKSFTSNELLTRCKPAGSYASGRTQLANTTTLSSTHLRVLLASLHFLTSNLALLLQLLSCTYFHTALVALIGNHASRSSFYPRAEVHDRRVSRTKDQEFCSSHPRIQMTELGQTMNLRSTVFPHRRENGTISIGRAYIMSPEKDRDRNVIGGIFEKKKR